MKGFNTRLSELERGTSNNTGLKGEVTELQNRIKALEQRFGDMGYSAQQLVKSEIQAAYSVESQSECLYGLQLGLCVSTIDPLKQNRVRFFHPALHNPDTPMKALPFADPVSAGFPGFDDCGVTWVPPAGTALALIFQNGHRESPFYFGSIWNRDRGNPTTFGCPVPEWDIWRGTRGGYLIGKDDETQVYPPWNTWNYNGFDTDSIVDFENDPEAQKRITYPHIYGIKEPEKGYLRWHSGDRKCNLRWKHTVWSSSRGNFIYMKDDHLHPAGQEANPSLGCGGGDASLCGTINDKDELIKETPACCTCGQENCPGGPKCSSDPANGSRCANPYFKRQEEGRPYVGPSTPLAPKVRLPQSGIHIQSLSGHNIEFDDSVESPTGKPSWDLDFGFGCTNMYVGKCWWQSATGHYILMNDNEDNPENRSDKNLVRIQTACGNFIELNDHTIDKRIGGEKRGVKIMSTSTHMLHLSDKDNEQSSPPRQDGGVPTNQAKNAYVLLRSGYGHHVYMNDFHNQEEADRQFMQFYTPQIGNSERGPHFMHMQVAPTGPGFVVLRAGGVMWRSSYDDSVETVGEESHPANKFTDVTGRFITNCDDIYVNINKLTLFKVEDVIILAAGNDCPLSDDSSDANQIAQDSFALAQKAAADAQSGTLTGTEEKGPCIYPVILAKKPWACPFTGWVHFDVPSMSDRLFASSKE